MQDTVEVADIAVPAPVDMTVADVVETPVAIPEGTDMGSEASFMDKIRTKFTEQNGIMEVTIFGLTGLVAGFLSKSFGKHFVMIAVGVLLTLVVLQYLDLAPLAFLKLREMFGILPGASIADIFNAYITWIKEHVFGVVSFVVGFFIGWKIG